MYLQVFLKIIREVFKRRVSMVFTNFENLGFYDDLIANCDSRFGNALTN